MSNGWDKGGSERLLCGESGGSDAQIIPASFLGRAPWPATSGTAPTVPVTTGDFSIECWARRKVGNSPGQDVFFLSGLLFDDSGLATWGCVFDWSPNSDAVGAQFSDNVNGGVTATGTPTKRGVWNHYAINADRDDDLTLYIDNEAKGTVSISGLPASLNSPEVHALTDNSVGASRSAFDADLDDWENNNIYPVIMGPIAVHNRLLTQDEIQASIDARYVQNISSVTLILWDWMEINGESGWDVDTSHMMTCFRMGLSMPAGMPLGSNGTVTVRDVSGNGRDWSVPTLTEYTTTTATKMNAPFGADAVYR